MKKPGYFSVFIIIYLILTLIQAILFYLFNIDAFTGFWLINTVFIGFGLILFVILWISRVSPGYCLNIFTLFSSLLLAFIILEAGLRLSGIMMTPLEKLPWGNGKYASIFEAPKNWVNVYGSNQEHKFNSPEFNYTFKTNRDGLSDANIDTLKAANEFRIAGLGDSFTEGIGTHQDSTWLKFLERNLQKRTIIKKIITMNGGIGGSDPFYEYMIFEKLMLKNNPDLLLIAVNLSDIGDVILRGGFERFHPDGTVRFRSGPGWEWIYQYLHIVRFAVHKILNYNLQFLTQDEQKEAELQAISKIEQCFIAYRDIATENNFSYLVIFHPWLWEMETENSKNINDLVAYCQKNNIHHINLLDYYKNIEHIDGVNAKEFFWKQDCHNNVKGYELFAKGVEWKMAQSGIFPFNQNNNPN